MDLQITASINGNMESYEINDIDPKYLTTTQLHILIKTFFQKFHSFEENNTELSEQNTVLQKRNTELVEENRKLKQQLQNDADDGYQFMFRTEQFNKGE